MGELAVLNTSLVDDIDISTIQQTMEKIRRFQALVKSNLVEEHDFGTIPGTNKPSLYKPGSEKICFLFGLNPEYEFLSVIEDFKAEFFSYNIKCTLYRNGAPCAQGVGSCNSKERKYRFVNVEEIPEGYAGMSEQFTNTYGTTKYKIENQDICSLVNTILKMAKKRAFVDATLQVASLSEVFTQDLEDMVDFVKQEKKAAASSMTPEQAGAIKLRFGKYKGNTLKEVYKTDKGYLEWLSDNERTDVMIKKAIEIMQKAVAEKKSGKKAQEPEPEISGAFPETDAADEDIPFDEMPEFLGEEE